MKRIFLLLTVMLGMTVGSQAQKMMSPPHVMILPSKGFCKTNGYMCTEGDQSVPDYEKALTEDPTLHSVLVKVAELITDRNSEIVIVDLLQAIENTKNDESMKAANDGDMSESIEDGIIRNSNADILIRVQYDMLKHGPQYQIQYTIEAIDAYTNQAFAPIEGLGSPSTSASPVVLLREAVYSKMDAFLDKVMGFYSNMVKNGRMVAFDINTTNSSAYNMNTKVGQYTLRENIEDFIFDNSVEGKGTERLKSTGTTMKYEGVYIPLVSTIRGRQRKQGAKDVAQKLVNFLEEKGITAEFKIIGLGKINVYIK